jgi:hypothetical protein
VLFRSFGAVPVHDPVIYRNDISVRFGSKSNIADTRMRMLHGFADLLKRTAKPLRQRHFKRVRGGWANVVFRTR